MDLFTESIQGLTALEKLRLVEQIWDDLAAHEGPIPLPDWAVREATRRRTEMIADAQLGMTHAEMWARIDTFRNF
jgi:putative addiction module component (TIGR02574 family)